MHSIHEIFRALTAPVVYRRPVASDFCQGNMFPEATPKKTPSVAQKPAKQEFEFIEGEF